MQQSMLPLSVVKDDKNIEEDRILHSLSTSHLTAAKQMAMNLGGYAETPGFSSQVHWTLA